VKAASKRRIGEHGDVVGVDGARANVADHRGLDDLDGLVGGQGSQRRDDIGHGGLAGDETRLRAARIDTRDGVLVEDRAGRAAGAEAVGYPARGIHDVDDLDLERLVALAIGVADDLEGYRDRIGAAGREVDGAGGNGAAGEIGAGQAVARIELPVDRDRFGVGADAVDVEGVCRGAGIAFGLHQVVAIDVDQPLIGGNVGAIAPLFRHDLR
jgi:hypothetical protein